MQPESETAALRNQNAAVGRLALRGHLRGEGDDVARLLVGGAAVGLGPDADGEDLLD